LGRPLGKHIPSFKQIFHVVIFFLIIAVIIWFMARSSERLGYHWQWYRVPRYLFTLEEGSFTAGPLLQGLKITLRTDCRSLPIVFFLCCQITGPRLSGNNQKYSSAGTAFFHLFRSLTGSWHQPFCFSGFGPEPF
jgi:polar amino acid transport system permease protein